MFQHDYEYLQQYHARRRDWVARADEERLARQISEGWLRRLRSRLRRPVRAEAPSRRSVERGRPGVSGVC